VSPAARGPGFARSRATNNVAQLRRATPADRCAGRLLRRVRRVSSARPAGLSRPCGRESLTRSEAGRCVWQACSAGAWCSGYARLGSLSPTLASSLRRVGRLRRAFVGGSAPHTPTFRAAGGAGGGVRRRGAGCGAGGRPQRRGPRANARLTRRRNTRAPCAGTSCIALSHRCTDVPYPTAPPGAGAARPHTLAAIARGAQ
jgi:hypothetical protein